MGTQRCRGRSVSGGKVELVLQELGGPGYQGGIFYGTEIIMAIYESARMHEVVSMPVRTKCSPLDVMIDEGALPVERPGRYEIRAFLLRGEEMRQEP